MLNEVIDALMLIVGQNLGVIYDDEALGEGSEVLDDQRLLFPLVLGRHNASVT